MNYYKYPNGVSQWWWKRNIIKKIKKKLRKEK